jgi:hypothetical protein
MIRNLGIPTARTGWVSNPEKTPDEYRQGLGGMGVSFPRDLVVACRKLIYSIIDTCTRTRADVRSADVRSADVRSLRKA